MTNQRPLLIGLTGNIGTGKSTVARMLAELGAKVIDADTVAHEVMRAGTSAHTQITTTFGPKVLAPNGEIDRAWLGARVFADPAALARLEAIVHPATIEMIRHRIATSQASVIVIEAIKLVESGLADSCDSIWVTTCQPEQQVYRIMDSRNFGRAEAEQRVRAQAPQEEKIARSDVVIDTSGELSWTRVQVQAAWQRLEER
ncbi:MAG: dephospho-CoA kinase [Chloroflexota bacterium]|nr:dephospho-CoA kinase [Chloroflexota bacterium]